MKKLLYLILILVTSFFLDSCSDDFLKLTPQSSLTSGNFFKTKDQLLQALNGAYESLRNTKSGGYPGYAMAEMRADNTHFENNPTCRPGADGSPYNIDLFNESSINPVVVAMWRSLYEGIARANNVIANASLIQLSPEDKSMIEGQARFLRAVYYFDLVRYFGGVPLHLGPVLGTKDAFVPRSTVDDVYKALVQDLTNAVSQLKAPAFPQDGRATQGSARMVLAEVYLFQKNFPLAEKELKSITQMGYNLLPNYASVFDLANKNSRESIFEVQYAQGNQGQQSNFYAFLPYTSDLFLITGVKSSNGPCDIGFNTPTGEIIRAFESKDSRLDASIAIAEGSIQSSGSFKIEAIKSPLGYITPSNKKSYAYIKKRFRAHSQQRNQADNTHVYRYSDALLLLADALNEQNKSSEALPYLNQVRSRAGLPAVTETNPNSLRGIIAHERRVELAFENRRWFDLLRTGKAIEVMTAHGQYIKKEYGSLGYLPPVSYAVTADKLIYPVPNREVEIGKLKQNPGY